MDTDELDDAAIAWRPPEDAFRRSPLGRTTARHGITDFEAIGCRAVEEPESFWSTTSATPFGAKAASSWSASRGRERLSASGRGRGAASAHAGAGSREHGSRVISHAWTGTASGICWDGRTTPSCSPGSGSDPPRSSRCSWAILTVVEAAAVGVPHDVKGQSLVCASWCFVEVRTSTRSRRDCSKRSSLVEGAPSDRPVEWWAITARRFPEGFRQLRNGRSNGVRYSLIADFGKRS